MTEELIVLNTPNGMIAQFGGLSILCSSIVEAQKFNSRVQAKMMKKVLEETGRWDHIWVEVHRTLLHERIDED